jgi:hypothetical protein
MICHLNISVTLLVLAQALAQEGVIISFLQTPLLIGCFYFNNIVLSDSYAQSTSNTVATGVLFVVWFVNSQTMYFELSVKIYLRAVHALDYSTGSEVSRACTSSRTVPDWRSRQGSWGKGFQYYTRARVGIAPRTTMPFTQFLRTGMPFEIVPIYHR